MGHVVIRIGPDREPHRLVGQDPVSRIAIMLPRPVTPVTAARLHLLVAYRTRQLIEARQLSFSTP